TNSSILFDTAAYYNFRTITYRQPSVPASLRLAVMKTTNVPILPKINSIVGNTVNITTSAPKSPEEHIYL
ncbi:hypothetical protein ACQ7B2_06590, partial [Escherichia coli]